MIFSTSELSSHYLSVYLLIFFVHFSCEILIQSPISLLTIVPVCSTTILLAPFSFNIVSLLLSFSFFARTTGKTSFSSPLMLEIVLVSFFFSQNIYTHVSKFFLQMTLFLFLLSFPFPFTFYSMWHKLEKQQCIMTTTVTNDKGRRGRIGAVGRFLNHVTLLCS